MPPKRLTPAEIEVEKEFERRINEWEGFVRMPTEQILKKVKYRVCVEKLFKPEEYAKLCKLEKKRIKNIGNNLTVMFFIGMPLPSENALRAKIGLLPKGGFKDKQEAVKEDDEEWKPSKAKPKQPGMINVTDYHKRKKFITTKCLVDNEKHDPEALKDEDVAKFLEVWPDTKSSSNTQVKNPVSKEKLEKTVEKKSTEPSRFPKRDIAHKVYTEPEVPEDDDYLYCESCDKLYFGDCPVHGTYTKIPDTIVKWGLVDRARRTCPDGISISQSKIRRSGLGAWADKDFLKDSVFGPYEGENVHKDDLKKLWMLFEGGYSWEIYKKGKLSHYIDGGDKKKSNWLRFINCARVEEEQNVVAYQYKGKIYYRAYKDIKKGTELLVWYGDQYAEQLGISTKAVKYIEVPRIKKYSESFQECQKCFKVFSSVETLGKHTRNKHPDRSVVKRHKCDFCSYSSDNKGNVDQHMRSHLKVKPFKCDVCGKRFVTNSNLKNHIRIHTKERPYKCDRCGKRFIQSSNLTKHIRTVHDKIKSHVCTVCGVAFGSSRELTLHMSTHTGVRDFKCQVCGKRFTQHTHLRTHERIHTGEKPFKCDECSAAFNNSSNLRSHIITQHSKRYPHRCPVCDKGFLAPGQLKKHQGAKH